jgi:tetratricopeptide (TPR) repeat protein
MRRLWGTLLLGCALAGTAHAADGDFRDGVAAARQGDYERALAYFQEARERGMDSPSLFHNLGVAYYKLGRYQQAREAFERASMSPKMRALSYYNLGLVAQKAGDADGAAAWFRKAHEAADTSRLRRLAAVQLGLEAEVTPPYSLYIEALAGHDDNPRLADNDAGQLEDRGREGDAVLGALVFGRYLLGGDWRDGAAAIGSAYIDWHPDLDNEDIGWFGAGIGLHRSPGDWRHELELLANQLRLGHDTLQNGIRAGIHSRRHLGPNLVVGLRLRSEYIDGDRGNGFEYVTGRRHQARMRLRGYYDTWRWSLHYEFEHNNREDLRVATDTGPDFFSVSPRRHEIGAGVERRLAGPYSGAASAAFRRSEYRDPEVRGGVTLDGREDERWALKLGVSRPLGRWTGRVETVYWDNESNFSRFEYDRLQTLISIGRSF